MNTDANTSTARTTDTATTSPLLVALAWLLVGIPLAYGLWQTLVKASALFTG
jgi:hypothetical protein